MMNNYNLASMIASFVNKGLSGKDIPSFYEVFPTFTKSEEEIKAEQNAANTVYAAQFKAFADMYNAQRKETH